VIRHLQEKRAELMDRHLPQTLISLIQAMEAGQGLVEAISSIAPSLPYPMNEEFERILKDIRSTNDVRLALDESRLRIPTPAWDTCATAIILQNRQGAKVVDVLRQILHDVSYDTGMRLRALAEASNKRGEAMLMVGMPIATFFLLAAISPLIANAFNTTAGKVIIVVAGLIDTFAFIWARRVTDIRRIKI